MKSNCHWPISPDHVVRSNTHPPWWSSPSLHADIPIPPTLQELKLKPYQGQSWQLHTSRILFVPSTNTKSSQRRRDQRSGRCRDSSFSQQTSVSWIINLRRKQQNWRCYSEESRRIKAKIFTVDFSIQLSHTCFLMISKSDYAVWFRSCRLMYLTYYLKRQESFYISARSKESDFKMKIEAAGIFIKFALMTCWT